MGTRFQRRIKIFPGITLNLSKSGISTSLGARGARMTFGNGKTRTTVGLPGTGLSHTTINNKTDPSPTSSSAPSRNFMLLGYIFVIIKWFFYFSIGMFLIGFSVMAVHSGYLYLTQP